MRRHRWGAAVAASAMAMAMALAACGGGGEDESDSSPAPEPTETTPAGPPPQPEGADGVTWEIQNWDAHAEDPAVLTWKQFNEAVGGSVNGGDLLAAARELSTREVLEPYLSSMEGAWQNDLVVKELAYVRVEESEQGDDGARLVACVWDPSAVFYQSDGEATGTVKEQWSKEVVTLEEEGDAFIISDVAYDGTCEGGAPA
ncbi:hypothetical protein ACHAAC_16540 [Aeromicrobium sp. CF4.19]|uniref:hypothetical protein n=1 Tax=Aeromicrobium sp. CF4.19 TaxID=3373082 RepID=UPI003EE489A7